MASNRTNFLDEQFDPMASADIRMRHFIGGNKRAIDYSSRYGLINDNSVLANRIEGGARFTNGRYTNRFIGTGAAQTNFGGKNTPSDPGGYNWDTFTRNLNRVADIGQGYIAYRMQNKRLAAAKAANQQSPEELPSPETVVDDNPMAPTSSIGSYTSRIKMPRLKTKEPDFEDIDPPEPQHIPF